LFEKEDCEMHGQARSIHKTSSSIVAMAVVIILFLVVACGSSKSPKEDIIVNAPASGVVRSVLVTDGSVIEKDAAIIEIAVTTQTTPQTKDQADKARLQATAARNDVIAAEAEANRTLTELQRIQPLVKRGLASQAELDKARAQDQDAQERLRRARDKAKSVEQQTNEAQQPSASEQIVAVRAPAAGTVREINVLAGQPVTAGQPLATLASRS
jgi:multidrug efflux pump subunit AcrA (membrane-fusion protein)